VPTASGEEPAQLVAFERLVLAQNHRETLEVRALAGEEILRARVRRADEGGDLGVEDSAVAS